MYIIVLDQMSIESRTSYIRLQCIKVIFGVYVISVERVVKFYDLVYSTSSLIFTNRIIFHMM